jgi:hypothetical protein
VCSTRATLAVDENAWQPRCVPSHSTSDLSVAHLAELHLPIAVR